MEIKRLYVYINPRAAALTDSEYIQEFLDQCLQTTNWVSDFNNIADVNGNFTELFERNKAFNTGIAYAEYEYSKRHNGIYINPMITGLTADFDTWFTILADDNDSCETAIRYVDVPYEVYLKAMEDQTDYVPVDRDSYDASSYTAQTLVLQISSARPATTTVH